jgi:hypothetical protein
VADLTSAESELQAKEIRERGELRMVRRNNGADVFANSPSSVSM